MDDALTPDQKKSIRDKNTHQDKLSLAFARPNYFEPNQVNLSGNLEPPRVCSSFMAALKWQKANRVISPAAVMAPVTLEREKERSLLCEPQNLEKTGSALNASVSLICAKERME